MTKRLNVYKGLLIIMALSIFPLFSTTELSSIPGERPPSLFLDSEISLICLKANDQDWDETLTILEDDTYDVAIIKREFSPGELQEIQDRFQHSYAHFFIHFINDNTADVVVMSCYSLETPSIAYFDKEKAQGYISLELKSLKITSDIDHYVSNIYYADTQILCSRSASVTAEVDTDGNTVLEGEVSVEGKTESGNSYQGSLSIDIERDSDGEVSGSVKGRIEWSF